MVNTTYIGRRVVGGFDNVTRAEEEGRYVKKPVVVRAKRLTECVFIPTLEGVMRGEPGDWLIEGVRGEVYACKPDIFEATYETEEELFGWRPAT